MAARKAVRWPQVVDDLTEALHLAVKCAARVGRDTRTTLREAVALEVSIARAVAALDRFGSTQTRTRQRR